MSKTLENLKSGNYEVVDNQGVSVTQHFIECLEKEFADLEAKLAEKEKQLENAQNLKAIEVADELSLKLSKIHNQDKISFCIEKLEKVKELMRNIDMPNKPELYNNDMFGAGFDSHYIRVEKLIDNQINELKGKVETIITHQQDKLE